MRKVGVEAVLIGCLLIGACDPFKEQREAAVERKRIDCLDKLCDGDVEPKRNLSTEVAMKLDGQWYVGPKYYYSAGKNGGGFYWPSRHPMFKGGNYPEAGQEFGDKAIEVFLTGRTRWPQPDVLEPWRQDGLTERLDQLRRQGHQLQREQLRPELEVWRVRRSDGAPYMDFYVATQQKRIRGEAPPTLGCSADRGPSDRNTCAAGEYWRPDIYADFRLSAAHAEDWPEIHSEIVRVLNQLTKVQP